MHFRAIIIPFAAVASSLLTAASSPGQVLRFTRIADESTSIRATGDAPALHSGVVAFYGSNPQTLQSGVFMAFADGASGFTVIAKQDDPIPNQPGRAFGTFGNPSTYGGVVALSGGWGTNPNGIYLGSGGELAVAVDQSMQRFPFLGPDGVTHQIDGTYEMPFFTSLPGGRPFTLADRGESAPGGGTFATFSLSYRGPSLGNGYASFAALVTHSGGTEGGLYVSQVATDTLQLIANWDNTMPGRSVAFERFYDSDTDGRDVVFTGTYGNINFGGHMGVYVAPLNSHGQGPLTVIAEKGQPAPGSGVPFHQFGEVAIEDGLVVFTAFLDSPSEPNMGLYGWRDGELFKIIDNGDPLFGEDAIDFSFTCRGLDRNQIVFRGRYVDPSRPFNQGYGTYVATLEGALSLLSPGHLARGSEVTFEAVGALPGERVYFVYSLNGIGRGRCPAPLGELCLDLVDPLTTMGSAVADAQGEAQLRVRVPRGSPLGRRVYVQSVIRRGPGGVDSVKSNATVSVIAE